MGSRMLRDDLTALAELTERPDGKPFLMLIAGEKMIRECGLVFNESATLLADRFWPGPLTLVVDRVDPTFPETLGDKLLGVAVRWSSHPEISRLVEGLDMPISSTSANITGQEPLQNVYEIAEAFEESVNTEILLLLDGGTLSTALPSTLVDCTSTLPRILREGAISRSEITLCLDEGKH